jgi:hypothetical protein
MPENLGWQQKTDEPTIGYTAMKTCPTIHLPTVVVSEKTEREIGELRGIAVTA